MTVFDRVATGFAFGLQPDGNLAINFCNDDGHIFIRACIQAVTRTGGEQEHAAVYGCLLTGSRAHGLPW